MSRALALWSLLALLCVTEARAQLPPKFAMGYLSDRVEFSTAYMQPALKLFRDKLAPLGVKEVTLEVAPSIEEMGEWVRSGRVDVFVSTPYPVMRTARIAGTEPVMNGVPVKPRHAAFCVRKDSPIKSLDDLAGKKLAFTFNYSTPGYFVPIMMLREHHYVLDKQQKDGDKVVFTAFTGHYKNSLYWLYFGRCDVAAVGNDDLEEVSPRLAREVRVLATSPVYPSFLVLVSPKWNDVQKQVLVQFLSHMHEDPAGHKLLVTGYKCDRMAPLSPEIQDWLHRASVIIGEMDAAR